MGDVRVQYVTDEAGEKTAALVPIEDWQKVMKIYQEFALAESIKAGFADIADVQSGKKEALTLEDLFDAL